ncbi:yrdC N(6)-threonylcarbamoyltransferase domain containing [Columba livia]|uniref:Threonylcarbamoyl-AMP synthase n=1 Tax=Columba livia TaxID=8932 RepID=A0A2I0LRU9_COLLI|nr:yrdC N(6)-threonylcarbamoyltransferase domain containing [Columba livia]
MPLELRLFSDGDNESAFRDPVVTELSKIVCQRRWNRKLIGERGDRRRRGGLRFRYCQVNVPDELLRDLLPGPVTLVLKRSEELNKDLNPFTSLVGVRIPNHPFIRELARACPGPLALTSANISCQASTLTVSEFQELWPQLSLIIDGGPIGDIQSPECRLGSTVVDLSVSGKFTIIRPGCALASTVEILRQKYGLIPEPAGEPGH